MQNFLSTSHLKTRFGLPTALLMFTVMLFSLSNAFAQQKKRTYANFQGKYEYGYQTAVLRTVGGVADAGNAVNGDPKTASSISIPITALSAIGSIQYLEFTTGGTNATARTIPANTPVSVKFSIPKELVGLLTGVSIGSFTNLAAVNEDWPGISDLYVGSGHNAGYFTNSTTVDFTGATLLGALGANEEVEITFSPNVAYNGIYLKLTSGAISLGAQVKLFHAYIMEDVSGEIACDQKIDVLSGVGSYIQSLDLTTFLGDVDNPWGPVDGSGNGYATLSFTAALADAYVFHRTIFNSPSVVGDTVSMTIRRPAGGLLDLELLKNSFSIQTYNRNVPGTQVNGINPLLEVEILPGNLEATIKFVPTSVFDRVELRFGGLVDASALYSSLELRAVSRIRPAPNVIQASTGAAKAYVFSGGNLTLSSTIPAGNTVNWFSVSANGSSVHTGLTYNLTNVTANTAYYAESSRSSCSEKSARRKVDVIVLTDASTALPVGIGTNTYPAGGSIKVTSDGHTFTYAATMPIAGLNFNTATGEITGSGNLPVVNVTTIYPITVTIFENGVSTGLTLTKNLTVHPKLLLPGGTFPTVSKNAISYSKNISVSVFGNGFGNATGGVTGATYKYSFTQPNLRVMAIPGGFTLSESGDLSGNPSVAGTSNNEFTIYVTDGVQIANAQYFLEITSAPLPVTLINFTAKKEGQIASLNWSTSSETNSDRFEVERSQNSKAWFKVGNVLSNGESLSVKPYSFVDKSPLNGENLYRLKMMDKDGSFAYSRIESLNFTVDQSVSLYPNPVANSEKLQIEVADWNTVKMVKVFDSLGKVIFESSNSLETGIKTDYLSSGLYIVQVIKKDGNTDTRKFIKL